MTAMKDYPPLEGVQGEEIQEKNLMLLSYENN